MSNRRLRLMALVLGLAPAMVLEVAFSTGRLRAAEASPIVRSEFIYEQAPFPSCHASTIVEAAPGRIVAAWFGGTDEKEPDVGIWVSHLEGSGWTAPVEVANGIQYRKGDGTVVRHPTWNPVLFQPRKGPLMLFYKVGPSPERWWGMLTVSRDGGRTWEVPRRLPEGIYGPIKNKPVELPNGDILCPTSHETAERPSKWAIYFERTGDLGVTWERTELLHDGVGIHAIQPSILFLGKEELLALGRTREGKVFEIRSGDLGRTWGAIGLTDLPNPNAGTDAVTLRDGRHVLVYNRTARGRTPLNVAVSEDGRSWRELAALETGPGEYSYPAVIEGSDGLVHVTYTWKREKIRHVVLRVGREEARPQ